MASAPDLTTAAAISVQCGVSWGAVYLGGPQLAPAAHRWRFEGLRQLQEVLPLGFLPVYVGRQSNPGINYAQGISDARDAASLAPEFGFAAGSPIALEVDVGTFASGPLRTLFYISSWLSHVLAEGYRGGVHASANCLASCGGMAALRFTWAARLEGGPDTEGYDLSRYADDVPFGNATIDLEIARPGFTFARL